MPSDNEYNTDGSRKDLPKTSKGDARKILDAAKTKGKSK